MNGLSIIEVGPRDGLQNEAQLLPTAAKLDLIGRLLAAGLRRIEVASFVHPKKVPQMADAEAVVAGLPDCADASWIGLCLNERGVERALATRAGGRHGIDEAGCVVAASDSFGLRNQGQTLADGRRHCRRMLALARRGGLLPQATIAVAFGCPFEGAVPMATVVHLAEELAEAGAAEIALADTIGVAAPGQVADLFGRLAEALPGLPLRAHFHNTRGAGLANAWAAHGAGVRRFDSSLGGLGGCPFAPKATGNVATEEVAWMFERSGAFTGLSIDGLLATADWLAGQLGRPLPSLLLRAGNWPKTQPRD